MKHIPSKVNSTCGRCGKRGELFEFELQKAKRIRLCAKCVGDMLASVIKAPKEPETEGDRSP